MLFWRTILLASRIVVSGATRMSERIDFKVLSQRECERVDWKENVADVGSVVKTLCAFANDWANLGGGYVVCGAREGKDEYGFAKLEVVGLSAERIREIEPRVLAECRDRVTPPLVPLIEEIPVEGAAGRVLVFIMPATRKAHSYRGADGATRYYVRLSRETREAQNGLLLDLFVRKGEIEAWDRRPCATATVNDIDLVMLRDNLQRMNFFDPSKSVDDYLSEERALSPFVAPLCWREPLTGTLRPRNFALLLFGSHLQSQVSGAYSLFSIYPGVDGSEPHAERHEIAGTILQQARRMLELLEAQSYTVFDKTDLDSPNSRKYPVRALQEAMVKALVHRDYELADPVQITAFSDRIEIVSPGGLASGVEAGEFVSGETAPKWRNQNLARFFNRLQLAQAEGQGIPTILRMMREEGCPPPRFEVNEGRVVCVLRGRQKVL